MAKTKRRQLAALAAQAELKELVGTHERTSSGHTSGPSGTIPQAGDPNVEIRTQRVIFKIPRLPLKHSVDTQPLKIVRKEVLGKRRRKKAQIDVDLSLEAVPADEAKISKGFFQSVKWKRHKKIRDLLPVEERPVPSSAELPNGNEEAPLAKSMASDKLQNGEVQHLVAGSQRQPKKRVKFMTGSRKRPKLQQVVVRASSEKEGKSMENQRRSKTNVSAGKRGKPEELPVRSPAKEDKLVETQGKSKAIRGSRKRAKPQEVVAKSPARRRSMVKGKSNAIESLQKRAKPQDEGNSIDGMDDNLVESFKKSKVIVGSRKRARPQEVIVRSPVKRESMTMATKGKAKAVAGSQRVKPNGLVVMSPTEERKGNWHNSKKAEERALDIVESPKRRARDPLVKDSDRSQELTKAGNGDLPSTISLRPASWKRRRGDFQKVFNEVPASPNAAVVSPHRTRSRSKISFYEATALEVLQEIQNVKNLTQQRENRGIIAANDTMARSTADAEETHFTQDQTPRPSQNCGNFTSPFAHGKSLLARVEATADCLTHLRNGFPTSYHTCPGGDAPAGMKSQFRVEEPRFPFAHGENRVLQVAPLQQKSLGKSIHLSGGNCNILREAEIIKRDSQLANMEKRLKAAGGRRKWLLDRGLEKFLPIVEEWNIDNLCLMRLTMEGLKSMGFLPVGPRRKLIHAVSSLTKPSSTVTALVSFKRS